MTKNSSPRERRSRGNAWYWKQTDSWYYTPLGTKKRVRLYDEQGQPIRGQEQRSIADLALARIKASGNWRPETESEENPSLSVAKVCSEFIEHCERRVTLKKISPLYRDEVVRYLNSFCEYCGALTVSELRQGHVQHWVESHESWKSPATRRYAMTVPLAALNHAEDLHGIPNPLVGLKKPPQRPRLQSFTAEEEEMLYTATDELFADFLFAAIHTGLRPFCELAQLTVDDVIETDRGMMWRIKSLKTKKTRKIPIQSEVAELTRRLITEIPVSKTTFVFRNQRETSWAKSTGVGKLLKIKRDLGWNDDSVRQNYSCYTCRHTFAHRMLAGYWNDGVGCSIEILAELMGNTPKVAFDHYGREWGQHYQEPLWAAIGVE